MTTAPSRPSARTDEITPESLGQRDDHEQGEEGEERAARNLGRGRRVELALGEPGRRPGDRRDEHRDATVPRRAPVVRNGHSRSQARCNVEPMGDPQ